MPPDDLLTIRQAAELLGVSADTVRRLADRGELKMSRSSPSGRRRLDGAALGRYAQRVATPSHGRGTSTESARNRFPGLVTKVTKDKVMAQIEVQADTQFRVGSSVGSGLRCARPAHHEAGAGHYATLTRLDDATVCTGTLAEVIGVDDQLFFADHGLESHILEQLRSDFRSGEILFRDGSRRLAMPSIVAIDSLNGG